MFGTKAIKQAVIDSSNIMLDLCKRMIAIEGKVGYDEYRTSLLERENKALQERLNMLTEYLNIEEHHTPEKTEFVDKGKQ